MKRICRLALVLLLSAAPALADDDGMRVDRSCLATVWAPDDAELAGAENWRDDGGRLSLAKKAPGGGSAIRMFSRADRPADLASYKIHIRAADRTKAGFARIRAEFFIPADTRFNVGGAKMPLGLYGGAPNEKRTCATGGCPPEKQTGFSVRLTRDPPDEARPWEHGPRIYSYHLNRDSRRVDFEDSHSHRKGDFDELQYGENFPMGVAFPLGEWFTLTLDVAVNRATETQIVADGFADLYMHDAQGNLMGHVAAERLIFRRGEDWHLFGPLLADLWGGDQTLPTRMPIMDTEMYSRQYRLSLLDEGRSLSECLDPARLPAGWPRG